MPTYTPLLTCAPCVCWSKKIGIHKLRTPFAERASPGNIAYMLAHQLQRNAALALNCDAGGTKLPDRDQDGYPLRLAAHGTSHLFFDADEMATGVVNLDMKFRIHCNDEWVQSNELPSTTSDVTLTAQMLPFKRDPHKASNDGEGRTHRAQDFNRKIVLAALLIQSKDYVLEMIQERELEGEQHWLTRTLKGRTVKWSSFSAEQKYTYASRALAFADAYIGFCRPATRVYYDAFAPVPNTPLIVTWGSDGPFEPISTLQLACNSRSRHFRHGPAASIPVGSPPGHSAIVRGAFLEGHTVKKDEPTCSVTERGRKAVDAIEDIGRKYELLRDARATAPCEAFAKWCEDNHHLGISNLLAFREAAYALLGVAAESHAVVRRAAQLVNMIDSLDHKLSRGRKVLCIQRKDAPGPNARLGLAGRTRCTKHNYTAMVAIQAEARKRKLSKAYAKLRLQVLRKTKPCRLASYMQLDKHATIPDGDEQIVTDMVVEYYNSLVCPDVRVEKQLASEIIDTMGRSLGVQCEKEIIYRADVGLAVLRNVMNEFLPNAIADQAKNQASCGGTQRSSVSFGIGCGLSSSGQEEYREHWGRVCADEKEAFEGELRKEATECALSRIWDVPEDPPGDATKKLRETAQLCGVVLARRFTSLASREKPAHYNEDWAKWPDASARAAQQAALWYAQKPRGTSKTHKDKTRLDEIKRELAPEQAPRELSDSDEEDSGGEE